MGTDKSSLTTRFWLYFTLRDLSGVLQSGFVNGPELALGKDCPVSKMPNVTSKIAFDSFCEKLNSALRHWLWGAPSHDRAWLVGVEV
jgi:hypothetical protein